MTEASVTLEMRPLPAAASWQSYWVGQEQTPLVVIDGLFADADWLCQQAAQGHYQADAANFYPGVRAAAPLAYQQFLPQLLPIVQQVFAPKAQHIEVLASAFSLACTPPSALKPIQMLPHFDTVHASQLAMVHYLCDESFGGTAFYRHQASGFERINAERLPLYGPQLKQQAMAARLHEHPKYIRGHTPMFRQIGNVAAKFNRAVIYPGNLLHAGDIAHISAQASDPTQGRLTISSFLQLS